jgi:hypothetical protein
MESHGPTASNAASTITVRAFSKTVAVTYIGLGLFGLVFLINSLLNLRETLVSRSPLFLIRFAVLLILAGGLMYVMLALHQRRNWARNASVLFWLLCLIWSASAIVRNGLHPELGPEPTIAALRYSNADQRAGGLLAQLVIPYFLAILESTAMYYLLRKASIVNQFKIPAKQ